MKTKRPIAKKKYYAQKSGADRRGIEFKLTFEEWDAWWLSNGIDKNQSQGPFTGNTLAMCRYGDIGPYELDNIYCATNSANVRIRNIRITKSIETPLGIFASRKIAAQAHKVDPATIRYRIVKKKPGYRYL